MVETVRRSAFSRSFVQVKCRFVLRGMARHGVSRQGAEQRLQFGFFCRDAKESKDRAARVIKQCWWLVLGELPMPHAKRRGHEKVRQALCAGWHVVLPCLGTWAGIRWLPRYLALAGTAPHRTAPRCAFPCPMSLHPMSFLLTAIHVPPRCGPCCLRPANGPGAVFRCRHFCQAGGTARSAICQCQTGPMGTGSATRRRAQEAPTKPGAFSRRNASLAHAAVLPGRH